MLAFLASLSVVAMALVFLGGAVYRESFELGLAMAAVGGVWLGILYAGLSTFASRVHYGTNEQPVMSAVGAGSPAGGDEL